MTLDNDHIDQLMGLVLDGQASPEEVAELEATLANMPSERKRMEQLGKVGDLLRSQVQQEMNQVDLSGLWRQVDQQLGWEKKSPVVEEEGVSWQERVLAWLGSIFPTPRMAWAMAASAALLVFVGLNAPRWMSPVEVAQRGFVEFDQIDSSADTTVMVYESPDDGVKFIWIFEESEPGEEQPI